MSFSRGDPGRVGFFKKSNGARAGRYKYPRGGRVDDFFRGTILDRQILSIDVFILHVSYVLY